MALKNDVIRKTGSKKLIAAPSEEDRATATGSMHKIGEVRPHGFRVMRPDRKTDAQTGRLIIILRNPYGAK